MKRSLLFLFLISGLSFSALAQRSVLRGTIVDAADNVPLAGAVVLVDSTWHAITSAQGSFSISNIPRKEAVIDISFLGYETIRLTQNFNQGTVNLGTIRMKETGLLIENVTVTAVSTSAVIKGDTTQYNAAAFKTNPDANAGDLLGKLPGVTVEEGTVTFQGETVARAYVDGKLFFGDDVMSALNNLPADAIEGIQMFDEMSDEAKFIGFDDGNRQRAINLVTKHKMNRSTTGRIEAGYGMELDKNGKGAYEPRYLVSGNVSTFTDKNRWSLNGTANNMNRANRGDGYGGGGGGMGFGGGLRTINSIGLNYNGTWSPQIEFNASYSYNQNRNETDSWTTRDYNALEGIADENRLVSDTTLSRSTNDTHRGNIRFEYEGSKDRIFFTANGSYGKNDSWRNVTSRTWLANVLTQNSLTATNAFGDNYSANGNLMWTRKLSETVGRTLTVGVNGRLNDNDSEDDREILRDQISSSHIYTTTNVWSRRIGGRISYAEPLSEKSRLLLSYRLSYEQGRDEVEAWDEINNRIDTAESSTFTRNELEHSIGLSYNYNLANKLRISTGLDYESTQLKRLEYFPEDADDRRSFRSWSPNINMRYTLDRSKYFELDYEGEADLPSIERLRNAITVNSANSLSAGNPDLKESYSYSLNLRYNTANTEKSTNFFLGINARLTRNNVSNRTFFYDEDTYLPEYNYTAMAGSQLTRPVNLNGAASLRSMGGFSFPLRKLGINVNLGGGYTYSRSPSYMNIMTANTDGTSSRKEVLNYANTHGGNLMVGFVSNISENVDFSIHSMSGLSYTSNTATENRKTWNQNITARANVIFLGGFTWNTDLSWRYQTSDVANSAATNSYIWNMGLGRKLLARRQAEFRITLYDLLNQSQKAPRISFADDNLTTSWSRSIGRYIMATLSYRFNSMNSSTGTRGNNAEAEGYQRREGRFQGGPGRPGGPPGGGQPMMGPGF